MTIIGLCHVDVEEFEKCMKNNIFIPPFDCYLGYNDVPFYDNVKEGCGAFGLWQQNNGDKRMHVLKGVPVGKKHIESFFGQQFDVVCLLAHYRKKGAYYDSVTMLSYDN